MNYLENQPVTQDTVVLIAQILTRGVQRYLEKAAQNHSICHKKRHCDQGFQKKLPKPLDIRRKRSVHNETNETLATA